MPIGSESPDAAAQQREAFLTRWHRIAHTIVIFPGIAIAYLLGSIAGTQFSVVTIILVMLALEAVALLIAFVQTRLGSGRG